MGRLRRSSQSKVSGCRTVKSSRLPPRSHPMILRRAFAQSRPASANTVPPASHATSMSSDTAPAAFNASLSSDSASTSFDASSPSDHNRDSPLSNRPHFVFAKQIHDYMIHSTGILQAQSETLALLNQKLVSLNQNRESLEHDREQEMNIRAAEVRCPLCSDLAWNPHVLVCGHSFCSKCLSQYKAECLQQHIKNPDGNVPIIRCPTCRSLILRKPQFSHTIQQGVEDVANYFRKVAPSPHQLEWTY